MASPENHRYINLTAQCLCKTHTFTTTLPASSLPLAATACHCTSCRHATGAMYTIDALWPGDPATVHSSTLKEYAFSPRLKIRFCATCSSPMFWDQPAADGTERREYGVFTGVLGSDGPGHFVTLTDHIFVGDTVDGGASLWLRGLDGAGEGREAAKRWAGRVGRSEELLDDWPGEDVLPAEGWKEGAEELPIRCHCKGVDLVYYRRQAQEENSRAPLAELSQHIDPASRKPIARDTASCRASSAVDFLHWTSAPLRHIGFPSSHTRTLLPDFPATLEDLHASVSAAHSARDARLGTLAVYSCAPDGVQRYFCARCSASVFCATVKGPGAVDVAVGLFGGAYEGARAEGTFTWLLGGAGSALRGRCGLAAECGGRV